MYEGNSKMLLHHILLPQEITHGSTESMHRPIDKTPALQDDSVWAGMSMTRLRYVSGCFDTWHSQVDSRGSTMPVILY